MVDWDSTNNYKTDNTLQSFIFSIDKKFVVKQNNAANTIYSHSNYGPTYGSNHDICIYSNSNANQSSYCNINGRYTKGFKSEFGTHLDNGVHTIKTTQIEIYKIIF